MKTLAVIGGGITGMVAAHLLSRRYEVSLFESESRLGGHLKSQRVYEGSNSFDIDLGFMLFNDRSYPFLHQYLSSLKIETRETPISWGFHDLKRHVVYSNVDPRGFLRKKLRFLSPRFWATLLEMKSFALKAHISRLKGELSSLTLRDFIDKYQFSRNFEEAFLIPIASALGLGSVEALEDYPAESVLSYFEHHGLFDFGMGMKWKNLPRGSQGIIHAFRQSFGGKIFLSTPVSSIAQDHSSKSGRGGRVSLCYQHSGRPVHQNFDAVVITAFPQQALSLLSCPSPRETELLSPWGFQEVRAVLHSDSHREFSPSWAEAAMNFSIQSPSEAEVSFDINRIQGLKSSNRYWLTLNPLVEPNPESRIAETRLFRTQFDLKTYHLKRHLHELNSSGGSIYFAGSYFGAGFLEDGVESALAAVRAIDPELAHFEELVPGESRLGAA